MSDEKTLTLRKKMGSRFFILQAGSAADNVTYEYTDFEGILSYEKFNKGKDAKGAALFYYLPKDQFSRAQHPEVSAFFKKASKGEKIVVGTLSREDFRRFCNIKFDTTISLFGREVDQDIRLNYISIDQDALSKNFRYERDDFLTPKKSKTFLAWGNPSTWVAIAFGLLGMAAAVFSFAPAELILTFMHFSTLATLAAIPLAVIFPIWLIWKDFKEQSAKFFNNEMYRQVLNEGILDEDKDVSDQIVGHIDLNLFEKDIYNSALGCYSPFTFSTYLQMLPRRFLSWANQNIGKAIVVGLGILAATTILFLLIFGSGLGPIGATLGFLTHLFSSAFMGLGTVLGAILPVAAAPVVGAVTGAIAAAATVIAGAALVTLPLTIADTVRRVWEAVEEALARRADYQLVPNEDDETPLKDRTNAPSTTPPPPTVFTPSPRDPAPPPYDPPALGASHPPSVVPSLDNKG